MAYKHVGYRGSALFMTVTLSNNDSLEFLAKELKRSRLEKKFTVADVSQLTNIRKQYLEQLEEGNFGFLPKTYVCAFAKEYMRAMELDCIEALEQCEKNLQLDGTGNKDEIVKTGSGHNDKNPLGEINIHKSKLIKSILPLSFGMFAGVLIGICSSYYDHSTNTSAPRLPVGQSLQDTHPQKKTHRSKQLVMSAVQAKPSPLRPRSSVSAVAPPPTPVSAIQNEATTLMRLLPDSIR